MEVAVLGSILVIFIFKKKIPFSNCTLWKQNQISQHVCNMCILLSGFT